MNKLATIFFLCFGLSVAAQSVPNASSLVLKEIMKGNDFIGEQPDYFRWSVDGRTIYFEWNPTNEIGSSTYAYSVTSKNPQAVKADPTSIFEFDKLQHAFAVNYYSIDGALVSYDKKLKKPKLIYQTGQNVHSIQRVNTASLVYFQQGINLFQYDQTSGSVKQVTNFKNGNAPENPGDSTFLMKEENRLFQYIQDQNKAAEWYEKNSVTRYSFPTAIYTGKEQLENLQISPSAEFVTFRFSDYPKEIETHVDHHISADGHTYPVPARAKVSDEDPSHRLGIMNIQKDSIYFIDFSKLTGIRKKPTYLNDATSYEADRNIIMHSLKFATNSNLAVCDVRSYDNKDRWIVLIDLAKGTFTEIDHQHDEAWIGGPGISSWNAEEGTLGWLKDGKTVYFQSEETGYSHLYLYTIETKNKEQRTEGNWEIYTIELSHDGNSFYITCNNTHPGNRDFYRYDIIARKMVPLLTKPGYHDVTLSPDEKTLAVRYSFKNKPWELYTSANVSSTQLKQITHSTTKQFDAYKWREPEVITFKGSDGKDVYARLYNPSGNKNQAAVIFVHGAGYLQNAHNYWSNYYREYMFHNLLVDNGFTVLDIDYRASEGYGRDYRTAIYRHMGGQDLQDHLSGKEYLVNQLGIDSNRVGIYGGSYGGFITLMAMLTTPGEFPCGAALRSVTDWAHYNHEYTSNILNYPGTDPEAYRKSSPIYYANNLEGKLLMLHGMVDDNVQFQDVVRLSQRFIELGKENWELAVFPVEAHGFKEAYSWNDEYRRIYELFYNELILNYKK
jgi:dipeptidyl aminopeptidase/acylaminoacyl peptidase